VVGIELSPIAVEEFFRHESLAPAVSAMGALSRHAAGPYELLCGDFFELTAKRSARSPAGTTARP
jgi:thiopurine S-methyltransferase